MKHRVYGKHFSRNKDERDLLFKSLVSSLFLHGTIEISSKKASAIKGLVDKIINSAKVKGRQYLLQGYLNKNLQERLIKEIAPKMENRKSGYTSLIRIGQRSGDSTMMVRMSLIGAEELKPLEKIAGKRQEVAVKKEGKKIHVRVSKKTTSSTKTSSAAKTAKGKTAK